MLAECGLDEAGIEAAIRERLLCLTAKHPVGAGLPAKRPARHINTMLDVPTPSRASPLPQCFVSLKTFAQNTMDYQ
jgi:hypothetical protein